MRSGATSLSQTSHWHQSAPELCHESFNIGMDVAKLRSTTNHLIVWLWLSRSQQWHPDSGVADLNRLSPDSEHEPGPRSLVEFPSYGPTTCVCVCINTAQSLVTTQHRRCRGGSLNLTGRSLYSQRCLRQLGVAKGLGGQTQAEGPNQLATHKTKQTKHFS